MDSRTIGAMIPVVAIIVGGIVLVTKAIIRHRERLAMIERGMHPDYPPAEQAQAEQPQVPSER